MTRNQNNLLAPAEAALALFSEYRERVIKGEINGRLLEEDYEPTAALRKAIREEVDRLATRDTAEGAKLADYLLITFSDDGDPSLTRWDNADAVLTEAARAFRNSDEPFQHTEYYMHLEVFEDGSLRKTILEECDVLQALAALPVEVDETGDT